MKHRTDPEANYRSIWTPNSKTFRFALDSTEPLGELKYPEFYDIKITDTCTGGCPWCYQGSTHKAEPYKDVAAKLRKFFASILADKRPYQIAYGGGEPTLSPEFKAVIRMTREEFDIVPNFTTNGKWTNRSPAWRDCHLATVRAYCGGVAVSTHPHMQSSWQYAVRLYTDLGIRTNLHCIVSDEQSVDRFLQDFENFKHCVEFFVLLPYSNIGRAENKPKEIAWDYLVANFPLDPKDKEKIAWGANFYPWLKRRELDVKVSLYEPELFSKYIDCKDDGYLYGSSFSDVILDQGFLKL